MRILVDECLSQAVADLLRELGHDAIHVGDRKLLGHSDPEVMRCALDEARVLVSADTDFGELLARSNAALPSVVLLRRTVHAPSDQATTIDEVLGLVADELHAGAMVVVSNDRIRVRPLPIRPA